MEDMNQISQAIVDGKLELAQELVGKAIESGMDAQSIIDDYLTAGMAEIGQRFQDRKAFVPNLLMSARAMKGALEVLKHHMSGRVESHVGTVVIGTVKATCTTSARTSWLRCSRAAVSKSSTSASTYRAKSS